MTVVVSCRPTCIVR
ncbi:hypothetical protein [uncultured Solobacterium sp.]